MGVLTVFTRRGALHRHCDALVKRELPKYPDQRITRILQTSRMCKGRLLHYFPSDHGGACAFMYLSK